MKNELKARALAKKHGWTFLGYQENIQMISFHKIIDASFARINIYLTKMTVATALNHPKHGKTQLYRKHVDFKLLERIFKNPRVHTDRGYRKKL